VARRSQLVVRGTEDGWNVSNENLLGRTVKFTDLIGTYLSFSKIYCLVSRVQHASLDSPFGETGMAWKK
jgi:hypothetical protein